MSAGDTVVGSPLSISGDDTKETARAKTVSNGFAIVANTTERGLIHATVKAGNGFMVWRLDGGTGSGGLELWNGSSWAAISTGSGGAGGGRSERFTLSATTTDADPGAGTLRISSGSYATAGNYTVYVDLLEYGGTDVTAWLDSFDDFVGSIKGIIRLQSTADQTKWVDYLLTAWTTATGYRKLSVTYLTGPGGLSTTAGDTVLIFDAIGVSSNLGNAALGGLKTLAYNSEIDDGNSSTAQTIDFSTGSLHKSTLTGNVTYTLTAPPAMTAVQLRVVQDGTGGRTVTWPGSVLWDKGYAPQFADGPSVETIIGGYYDGTNYRLINPDTTTRYVEETTTTRTCVATDRNALIDCTHASGCSATIPPHSAVPYPKGTAILFRQGGAGQVTLVQGAGVTITTPLTLKSLQQYAVIGVLKIANNTWTAFGLLAYS